jgi:diguanylate cyclase (GGDEF)-like protein/PAS domain S-box-containing protein
MNIANAFRNSSIRVKLSLLVVLNGAFALLLVGVSLLGYERYELRSDAQHALMTQAGILAESSTGALSFKDEQAATDNLSAFHSDPALICAAIYDSDNTLLASYSRDGNASTDLARIPRERLTSAEAWIENGSLSVSHPVAIGGRTIGAVFLRSSMSEFDARLRRYMEIVSLVLLVSLTLALVASGRMQRTITTPLAYLASVARQVSIEKDYTVRAKRHAHDEVGFLIDSFNEMLLQIELREEARRGAEASLRESEERFALAARGANDGLWDWKQAHRRMYISPRGNQMLGYPDTERFWSVGRLLNLVHPADRERVRKDWIGGIHEKGEFVCEFRARHQNGTFIWVLSRGKSVKDAGGSVIRAAGSLTDVTDGKIGDPLTGLPNRLYFLDRLENSIDALRHGASAFAVLFVDVDQFKLVNDSLGHAAGDSLLYEVAQRLRSSTQLSPQGAAPRPPAVVARLSGDEFAILAHCPWGAGQASALAERILKALSVAFELCDRQMFASVSIGIALSSSGDSPEDLLRNADTAMYQAKKAGRARFEVFDDGMRQRALARLEIETDLRKAIEQNQLVLFYQPQISIPGRTILGFEALVRWQHPERGLIPPGDFIFIAEETDLIIPLGGWVLREACRQTSVWQRRFPMQPPLTVAVNVSYKQLRDAGFVEDVRRALAESGLLPGTLHLEMTESTAMTNTDETISTLERLKGLDVRLEIDDFGTGYSSLSSLNRLPFDTVKIDCSFVRELTTNEESSEIVRAILDLARSMSMSVVAEGVETQDQLKKLETLGCSCAQGYYFSRPLEPAHLAVMLERDALERDFSRLHVNHILTAGLKPFEFPSTQNTESGVSEEAAPRTFALEEELK